MLALHLASAAMTSGTSASDAAADPCVCYCCIALLLQLWARQHVTHELLRAHHQQLHCPVALVTAAPANARVHWVHIAVLLAGVLSPPELAPSPPQGVLSPPGHKLYTA
jgi:hypothetical protein